MTKCQGGIHKLSYGLYTKYMQLERLLLPIFGTDQVTIGNHKYYWQAVTYLEVGLCPTK